MTDNIKPQEPLKTLREHGLAMVTKGWHTGRFVKIINESSYKDHKIVWSVRFCLERSGDDLYPRFNEDMLMCVDNPLGEQVFKPKKF